MSGIDAEAEYSLVQRPWGLDITLIAGAESSTGQCSGSRGNSNSDQVCYYLGALNLEASSCGKGKRMEILQCAQLEQALRPDTEDENGLEVVPLFSDGHPAQW
eukprot:IDg6617t1